MNKKHMILVIAIVFLISTFSGILSGEEVKIPKKALKLEKQGDKATKAKELDKALELYKQAIEIYPDMDTVHYKIASIHAFKKNYKEAYDELNISLKINRDNINAKKALIDTTLKYGTSLLKKRNVDEANNLFIALSGLEGINELDNKLLIELDYRIGFNFFQMQKPEKSNEYLLKFLNEPTSAELFPNFYPTAHYLVGLNFSQAENIENSNKYLNSFIELTKANPENRYLSFAKYIVGMNNFNALKEKIEKIEKAKNRKNMEASDKKILELASSEKGVEENLLFTIEKNPELENAYVLLGNFYYLKKDIDNSIKYYKLLIEKFPGSADIEVYKVFLKDIEKRK